MSPIGPIVCKAPRRAATFEETQGDIRGALGTIRGGDTAPRAGWWARLRTLLAVIGPGLIVMVGDNDAGAFSTYAQAGQDYGTTLLWTLLLLVPVLYVNQEMVLAPRCRDRGRPCASHPGAVRTLLGRLQHHRPFFLNALTIVTEFIGISLALGYLGLPKEVGVASAAVIIAAAGTGDFRRFERFSLLLVVGSLLIVPVLIWAHPPVAQIAHDLLVPELPVAKLGDVMLLIVAIVGTTVAPWQLFFQQSYVIDKCITPRFMRYERADLWIGIALVVIGAVALMACAAAAFAGRPEFGHFEDAGAVAAGLARFVGPLAGDFFAIALIDACVIGAMAVSLSTAYAIGDVLALSHSLNRKPKDAKVFYGVYGGLVTLAAALVLTPGTPLGLLTNAVQALAGVLLPSATVFLLLLCNDREVLGPWVNGRWQNLFTGGVVAALVMLSVILTAAVLFPDLDETMILTILGVGTALAILAAILAGRTAQPVEPHLKAPLAHAQTGKSAAAAPQPSDEGVHDRPARLCGRHRQPRAGAHCAARDRTWLERDQFGTLIAL